jgi:predicted nucleotidyltransferase
MRREDGIHLARKFKERLLEQQVPVRQVLLFGSVARGEASEGSDVDIAVVCDPFRATRLEENVEIARGREGIDLRIETICLHPNDLENRYSIIGQEVKRYGIPV